MDLVVSTYGRWFRNPANQLRLVGLSQYLGRVLYIPAG